MSHPNPTTLLELADSWEELARESFANDPGAMAYSQALRMCARQLGEMTAPGSMGAVPHNGTDTSKAAAASITDRADRHEEILDLFRKADSINGLTCGQVEDRLPHRTHQSVSARIRELSLAGKLVDSGHRRKNPSTGRTARIYWATGR